MSTCLHPTIVHGVLFPCGKCPVCTQNKRNSLTSRFLLESSFCGGPTYFLTLTYDDNHLPYFNSVPCFDKKQVRNFIKRLRYALPKFKFFLTCEYGDHYGRPHYHALIFLHDYEPLHVVSSIVAKCWPFGYTTTYQANDSCMAYCAKYTLKNDAYLFKDLDNKNPIKPFRLWSLRPGIGSSAIDFLNDYIYNDGNIRSIFQISDKRVIFDTYIKRHLDPSVYEELKRCSYLEHFQEIQDKLLTQFWNHKEEKFDEVSGQTYLANDYTKDNQIRNHRNRLTKFHKSLSKL